MNVIRTLSAITYQATTRAAAWMDIKATDSYANQSVCMTQFSSCRPRDNSPSCSNALRIEIRVYVVDVI